MRIALAQVNAVVGDIEGNAVRVVRAMHRAHGAGANLTVFPELVLTGYPPEDLLARAHFVHDNLEALKGVAAQCAGGATLAGFVDADAGVLYNAAALIRDGAVEHVYRKRMLPNYGVFDEERYFEPGASVSHVAVAGETVSVTVCEDVWIPGVAAEAARDARVLVNLSASPFHTGKGADREAMLAARAAESGVWLAFCNLVGGQDELVFDGRSVLIDPSGTVLARAAAFAEDLLIADIPGGGPIAQLPDRDEEVYAALTLGLRDYVEKNGFREVVVGLSGGIDSALTAAVAVDAIGAQRVHGVTMPSRYSSSGSVDDSHALAANLGFECRELPIERPFAAMLDTLEPHFAGYDPDVTEENLQARVRGMFLMALSNKFGWLVLATGNKSELAVGYSTLYGDMVGGFAPIKDIFKTRAWELARWRNRAGEVIPRSTIEELPSAELAAGQTDYDTLPHYDVLDAILTDYVERDFSRERIIAAGYDREVVERVCRMVDGAEYKRRQGPVGIRVTPKAFGKDRRMPITNRYEG